MKSSAFCVLWTGCTVPSGSGFIWNYPHGPKKSIGTDEAWQMATEGLESALKRYGREYKINPGDGAFYGPKIDIHIKDALGRTWQCGTVQLDMSLPERFNLNYIGKDNEKHRPIMIHRVIYGSIERFFGILVEHFAGQFPLWMAPVQVIVLPINDDLAPYAESIREAMENEGLRVTVDDRTESLNKKVREAQLEKIPLILTIGGKEKEAGTLSVRTLDGKVRYGMSRDMFVENVLRHIRERKLDDDIFPE